MRKIFKKKKYLQILHNLGDGVVDSNKTFIYPDVQMTEFSSIESTKKSVEKAFKKLGLTQQQESYTGIEEIINFGIFSHILSDFRKMFSENTRISSHFTMIQDYAIITEILDKKAYIYFYMVEQQKNDTMVIMYLIMRKHTDIDLAVQHYFCIGQVTSS